MVWHLNNDAAKYWPEKVRDLFYMKNMINRHYTGINVDIVIILYLVCFYRTIWFVKPFKWICEQAFSKKLPDKYMYSVYKCLAFTKSTVQFQKKLISGKYMCSESRNIGQLQRIKYKTNSKQYHLEVSKNKTKF